MFKSRYSSWLVPYIEGSLDERRRLLLEERLANDSALAAEAEALRRVTSHLRETAQATRRTESPTLWPHLQGRLSPPPRRAPVMRPPLVWAGGTLAAGVLAVTLTVALPHQAPVLHVPPPGMQITSSQSPASGPVTSAPPPTKHAVAVQKKQADAPAAPASLPDKTPWDIGTAPRSIQAPVPGPGPNSVTRTAVQDGAGARVASKANVRSPLPPPALSVSAPVPTVPAARPDVPLRKTAALPEAVLAFSPSAPVPPSLPKTAAPPAAPANVPAMAALPGEKGRFSPPVDAMRTRVMQPKSVTGANAEGAAGFGGGLGPAALLAAPSPGPPSAEALQRQLARPGLTPEEQVGVTRRLALAYTRQGNVRLALDSWQQALTLTVTPPLYGDDAGTRQAQQTLQEARDADLLDRLQDNLRRRERQLPGALALSRVLASVYDYRGQAALARAERQRIVQTGAASGEDWFQYAQSEEQDGNAFAARLAYQQALSQALAVPPPPDHCVRARARLEQLAR